jgi:hypothetical protein
MVNLKKLKIRITGSIPDRFRDIVESDKMEGLI